MDCALGDSQTELIVIDKDIPQIENDSTDDEDFFSIEADEITIPTDDPQNNTSNEDKMLDASGSASSVSETPSADFC